MNKRLKSIPKFRSEAEEDRREGGDPFQKLSSLSDLDSLSGSSQS